MNVTITISEDIARHLNQMPFQQADDMDSRLRILLEAEYRRQLAQFSLTDRELARKYKMSFDEFERQRITEQKDYSWEVESDAIAWDTAVDGIRTVRRQLMELKSGEKANDH